MKEALFAKNRTEELGYDIWEDFVIPPYFNNLDLFTMKKPKVIIGGRGCGKTMLLRYLCHESAFSPNRLETPIESIEHIGIYWKVDTQFAKMLTKRGKDEEFWGAAFGHMGVLMISIEILKSLKSLSNSTLDIVNTLNLKSLNFEKLKNFMPDLSAEIVGLTDCMENMLIKFQFWLNNINKESEPHFFPKAFLLVLISEIKKQVPSLIKANYYVYLDEYENLLEDQQRLVNTWLKHSEMPLIFNLAMKRNAFIEKRTIGNESLSDIHDFRTYDLEAEYNNIISFQVFAAEILFLPLLKNHNQDLPTTLDKLRNANKLSERTSKEYKHSVIDSAEKIFPSVNVQEISENIFNERNLFVRLRGNIEAALKYRNSKIDPDLFMVKEFPEASLICPALLYRETLPPEEILVQLTALRYGKQNKFSNWIHNNIVGCIILFYEPLNRPCPIYAGFRTFCQLSHGNIRHLLELCHKSLEKLEDIEEEMINWQYIYVKPDAQALAAQQASAAFLNEVKTFGKKGNQLHSFVMRLGSLFSLAQKRPTQSEPEQNHFSITCGNRALTTEQENLLLEATKWSVLFEVQSTKQKSKYHTENSDFILNPIYAPYFHISYRKKRKVELNIEEFICIASGNIDEFELLFKSLLRKWSLNSKDYPLFSNLNLD